MTGGMPMGPEAVLVRSRSNPRSGLAEFARLEYPRLDPRSVEAMVEVASRPPSANSPGLLGLFGRAPKWLRRGDVRIAASVAARRTAVEIAEERVTRARPLAPAPLAALPGIRSGLRPEGAARPISAVPVFGRD
jgi:hypothetical protein